MTKRTVTIVSETYRPEVNGVANTLGYWVDGLKRLGYQVQIVRPKQNKQDTGTHIENEIQVTTTGLPIPGYPELKFGLPAKGIFCDLWNNTTPDAVYVATEGPLGWSACREARRRGVPVISGFHTNFQTYSRFYGFGWLEKLIIAYLRGFHNKTHATLVPTKTQAQYLECKGFINVKVISRGVDCDKFCPSKRDQALRASWGVTCDATPVLIYVGRLAEEKNVQQIVDAYQQLKSVKRGIKEALALPKLVFVGDGPARPQLQARLPDAIFAGMQHGEDLARHYASADVFLFPSKTDTFGNVVTEAMASRLAVVAFNDAAAREHLAHRTSAMLSELNDDQGFNNNLRELLADSRLLEEVRTKAHAIAQNLSWTKISRAFATSLSGHGMQRSERFTSDETERRPAHEQQDKTTASHKANLTKEASNVCT